MANLWLQISAGLPAEWPDVNIRYDIKVYGFGPNQTDWYVPSLSNLLYSRSLPYFAEMPIKIEGEPIYDQNSTPEAENISTSEYAQIGELLALAPSASKFQNPHGQNEVPAQGDTGAGSADTSDDQGGGGATTPGTGGSTKGYMNIPYDPKAESDQAHTFEENDKTSTDPNAVQGEGGGEAGSVWQT